MDGISVWPVIVLAMVHLFGSRSRHLIHVPRSIWLSIAGGVAVAYVFMHLFPEMHEGQQHIVEHVRLSDRLQHHIYMVALIGLTVFYGLERAVIVGKRKKDRELSSEDRAHSVFWLHIASFSFYNALIGHIMFNRNSEDGQNLIMFTIAMALHFLVNDLALLHMHKEAYRRYGRWSLVLALLIGWSAGYLIELSRTAEIVITAFIGGGIILNVLKEELPEHRQSRYWAFVVGVASYGLLWLLL